MQTCRITLDVNYFLCLNLKQKVPKDFFSGFSLHHISLKAMQTTLITTASHIRLCDNKKPQGHSISRSKTCILLFYSQRSSRF